MDKFLPQNYWLEVATNIAYSNLGRTGYKPSVGCVIVKDGVFLASGVTQAGVTQVGALQSTGQHAEFMAINFAQKNNINVEGAVMYVTLEPCVHWGQTPPCVNAILNAGIKKVVVGVQDPDPRVSGKGVEFLQKNGIEVKVVNCEKVKQLYCSYFVFKNEKRPYVVLKIAQSLDGKIATGNGVSKWVTSSGARRYTNFLRSRFCGILVGKKTIESDSPKLTCRIDGLEKFSPKKFCASMVKINGFVNVGGSVLEMLNEIYQHNIQHLLVEGGANLITQFVKENLFDEIIVVQAPVFIGSDGMGSVNELGLVEVPLAKMQIIEKIEIDNNIIVRLKNEK